MRRAFAAAVAASLIAVAACAASARDAPVSTVRPGGPTIGPSRVQRGGPHGDHQLLPLRVPLDGGGTALVEVVTNDSLDGRVTAPRGATVFAYGQYFHTSPRQRPFVTGVHDVHCATHRGADNGGVGGSAPKSPQRSCRF